MKKIIFTILLLLIASNSLGSDWYVSYGDKDEPKSLNINPEVKVKFYPASDIVCVVENSYDPETVFLSCYRGLVENEDKHLFRMVTSEGEALFIYSVEAEKDIVISVEKYIETDEPEFTMKG